MAPDGSAKVILLALVASALSTAASLWAAAATGAAALVALGLLFVAATGSQALILIGLRRRKDRPPEKPAHPADLYVWSYVAALLLFALSAGVAIDAGAEKLAAAPRILLNTGTGYAALALALVLTVGALAGIVFLKNPSASEARVEDADADTKAAAAAAPADDPPLHTTLVETVAALAGLLVAAVGFALAHAWGSPITDGNAAILVGLLIGTVAAAMVIEIRRVLLAASPSHGTSAAGEHTPTPDLVMEGEAEARQASAPQRKAAASQKARPTEPRVSRSAQKRRERDQRRKPY